MHNKEFENEGLKVESYHKDLERKEMKLMDKTHTQKTSQNEPSINHEKQRIVHTFLKLTNFINRAWKCTQKI